MASIGNYYITPDVSDTTNLSSVLWNNENPFTIGICQRKTSVHFAQTEILNDDMIDDFEIINSGFMNWFWVVVSFLYAVYGYVKSIRFISFIFLSEMIKSGMSE